VFSLLICTLGFGRGDSVTTNYTVHEWGTFTSVQGGDGQLLPWRPLQTSELPHFVYDWTKAGLNRGGPIIYKGGMITLQRMETPVMYFYSDQPMSVGVNVAFPSGTITEWFPQASQIGPTFAADTNVSSDSILHESRAVWKNLQITPPSEDDGKLLPQDTAGSHYFAARATRSDFVHTDSTVSTNNTSELEKFIFYRGAGSFKTPLHVTVDSNNLVTVENTGPASLAHLFLVNIHDGVGAFGALDELPASNSVAWLQLSSEPADHWTQFPLADFQTEIGAQMQSALASEGLFPDEAQAMVDTWKDSWFSEPGVRVLYILPRAWTDEILPLALNPQPTGLNRVMVGRAEVITPDVVKNLVQILAKAAAGDADAAVQARKQLKALGRFAPPAVQLVAAQDSDQSASRFGYQLLYPPAPTETK
jgi:hypothetical protein